MNALKLFTRYSCLTGSISCSYILSRKYYSISDNEIVTSIGMAYSGALVGGAIGFCWPITIPFVFVNRKELTQIFAVTKSY